MKTSISDYELERAATRGPEADGVTAVDAVKSQTSSAEDHAVTKSKVVEADEKPVPKKTAARSKAK